MSLHFGSFGVGLFFLALAIMFYGNQELVIEGLVGANALSKAQKCVRAQRDLKNACCTQGHGLFQYEGPYWINPYWNDRDIPHDKYNNKEACQYWTWAGYQKKGGCKPGAAMHTDVFEEIIKRLYAAAGECA